jgi:hypothetical protein
MSSSRPKLEAFLVALALLLVAGLVVQEIPRVLFPWDLRIFSESPFLTDMQKLTAGQSVYTRVDDCNSYIYSPGLVYLTRRHRCGVRVALTIAALGVTIKQTAAMGMVGALAVLIHCGRASWQRRELLIMVGWAVACVRTISRCPPRAHV